MLCVFGITTFFVSGDALFMLAELLCKDYVSPLFVKIMSRHYSSSEPLKITTRITLATLYP